MKHLPFIILLVCLIGCGNPQRDAARPRAGAIEQARFPLMAWDYWIIHRDNLHRPRKPSIIARSPFNLLTFSKPRSQSHF